MADLVLYMYQKRYEDHYGFGQGENPWDKQSANNISLWEYVRDHVMLEEFCCAAALSQMAEEEGLSLNAKEEEMIQKASESYFTASGHLWSRESIAKVLSLYRLAQLYIGHLTADVSVQISDDEARVIQLTMFTFSTKEAADSLHGHFLDGDSLEAVTAKLTDGTAKTDTLRRGEEAPIIEEEAFRLKSGEFSSVFSWNDQWYVLYCVSDYNTELTEENRQAIFKDRKTQAWMPIYEDWIAGAGVSLDTSRWNRKLSFDTKNGPDNLFSIYQSVFPSDESL